MPDASPSHRSGHLRLRLVVRVAAGTLMVGSGLLLFLQTYLDG